MDAKPDQDALEEAARWHARLLAPDCSPNDRAAFDAWRSVPPHACAYSAAERLAGGLSRLAARDRRLQALATRALALEQSADLAPRPRAAPGKRSRWTVSASLAAGLALAFVAVREVPDMGTRLMESTASYTTAAGELKDFTLADGSVVHADVDTRLFVRISGRTRQVDLLSGRALFEVAHDTSRPFSVTAGATRTVALGTRFQVQHQDQKVSITLAEGSVAVSDTAGATSWKETLVPGEQILLSSTSATPEKRTIDPQLVTSWSRGRHLFRGTPLSEALVEVNRYAPIKVRLGDPTLGELPVGGNFIAGDSERIVAAFAALLPLEVVESGNEILLFRRHEAGT